MRTRVIAFNDLFCLCMRLSLAWQWVRAFIQPCGLTEPPSNLIFRNPTVSPAGTPVIFEDCNIFVIQLSILAQTPLVACRRYLVLPLHWAPPLMDHPHADHLGVVDAVDVLQCSNLPRQRSSLDSFVSYHNPGLRPLTADFIFGGRSQALDHIHVLTVVFTSLVVIAATQGNVVYRSTLSGPV
jgi:hypothetical protein